MLGMSLVRLPFAKEQPFCRNLSQKFLNTQKKRPQEATHKNKNSLYEHLRTPLKACPQRTLLRNQSKGMILPGTQFVIGQEIPANYIV
jgi:hypothetical protein